MTKESLEAIGWKFIFPDSLGWFIAVPPGWKESDGQACLDESDALRYAEAVTKQHGLETEAGRIILGVWYLDYCNQREAKSKSGPDQAGKVLAGREAAASARNLNSA